MGRVYFLAIKINTNPIFRLAFWLIQIILNSIIHSQRIVLNVQLIYPKYPLHNELLQQLKTLKLRRRNSPEPQPTQAGPQNRNFGCKRSCSGQGSRKGGAGGRCQGGGSVKRRN